MALRVLPTLGRPHAVALHFVCCGQLTGGLSSPRSRPFRAHKENGADDSAPFLVAKSAVKREDYSINEHTVFGQLSCRQLFYQHDMQLRRPWHSDPQPLLHICPQYILP